MTRSVTIYLQSFRLSVCFRPILASPIQAYQVCSDSERCCTDCHRHRTRKYDQGLSHLLHTELHWLDVPERVLYKLALMVHRPPISPRQGAAVSVELLCASLWSCQSSATAICLSSSASTDPTISSQNIRPSGFCCGWPDVLELTGRWTANLL